MSDFEIAVIGAGPAGLSAAARAALHDRETLGDGAAQNPRHILLEGTALHANTIQRYQKGKHVMDEPGYLDLRSPMDFSAGTRENILDTWEQAIKAMGVNMRAGATVNKISGSKGAFEIHLAGGETVTADHVILSIGTQGNPRRLGVPGDDSAFVQYQLDDPDEYEDEDIVVVGAGDAAIENAVALARQNRVTIVNRKNEFARAKQGNVDGILQAINDPGTALGCRYQTTVKGLQQPPGEGRPGAIILNTPDGEEIHPCHRIIGRLGSIPPRGFLDDCGIALPNESPEALPELDSEYQCNVAGLYVIGALAGYPLIKQAMNQGQDVVDYIHGKEVRPVEHPLLALQFGLLPYQADVDEVLALYQQRVPMFARMNSLAFRELILESDIHYVVDSKSEEKSLQKKSTKLAEQRIADIKAFRAAEDQRRKETGLPDKPWREIEEPSITGVLKAGDCVYKHGDYSTEFYTIVEGEVVLKTKNGPETHLQAGQFFGEMSLLSGRPRLGDAVVTADTILIATPRRVMLKLMAANSEVSSGIETVFMQRTLQQFFAPSLSYTALRDIARKVTTKRFNRGDVIYTEGETGHCLYLIRSGTVSLTALNKGRNIAVGHPQSGEIFGQLALMGDPIRRESATAAVRVEAIEIKQAEFLELLKRSPDSIPAIKMETREQLLHASRMESVPEASDVISFLLGKGLGEATDALVIDESLCVNCDNCEIACAETHNGVSRLNRKAGTRFAHINLPIACRHCEQPHCMKECPPNAIHRKPSGEVFIDDSCIGCGNCESNCPYDVIRMEYPKPSKPGLLSWLFTGAGPGPGEDPNARTSDKAKAAGKKAVKCDACKDRKAGPACVQACPTGAAVRMSPSDFADLVERL